MKKIIVPVDFSKHSGYALETAAILAKKYDAEIIALHMLELSDSMITKSGNTTQMEGVFYLKLAQKNFDTFLDKGYLVGVKVTPIIKHYKVYTEVNEIAKEENADLIILGSHGTSGMKEIFIGSNTEKMVRYATVPVLVVKHNPILTDFENVAFACDFSEEAINAYQKASKLFNALGTTLQLVYVNLPGKRFKSSVEMEQKVAAFLKEADGDLNKLNSVHYVADYSVEKGILNFASLIGADLITIATHGRKGVSHFLESSISEGIANHSTLPVMTFKI